MHIFHKWSKWSKPEIAKFDVQRITYWGETINFSEEREYQDRECVKCGEYQWRFT